jgi:hypothetical protein
MYVCTCVYRIIIIYHDILTKQTDLCRGNCELHNYRYNK